MQFSDVLVKKNIVTQEELNELLSKSSETDIPLEKLLEAKGVSKKEILEAKSEVSGVETRKVVKDKIPFDILKKIPEEAVRHYKFVPLGVVDGTLEIGMVNPDDVEAREALQFIVSKLNLPFKIFLLRGLASLKFFDLCKLFFSR